MVRFDELIPSNHRGWLWIASEARPRSVVGVAMNHAAPTSDDDPHHTS
jgi:hypothetical protein